MMPTAYGYEVGTHARVTDEAYKRSTLFIGPKLAQFGLLDLSQVVGTQFKEVAGSQVVDHSQFRYEWNVEAAALMNERDPNFPGGTEPQLFRYYVYRPVGWLTAGAIREDDAA
ncbi:MAG: hypothetical protein LC098_00490, partial [Burkholderiales bacterium]|nr:hypothetical protein [Burkholderiales bacterium]